MNEDAGSGIKSKKGQNLLKGQQNSLHGRGLVKRGK
jgi:hypothetical protein